MQLFDPQLIVVGCAKNRVVSGFSENEKKYFECVRDDGVIGVHEKKERSTNSFECGVASGARAGVWPVYYAETRVGRSVFVENRTTSVRASVIDADAFPIRKCLCCNGVKTLPKPGSYVVYRNDDGKNWHWIRMAIASSFRRSA